MNLPDDLDIYHRRFLSDLLKYGASAVQAWNLVLCAEMITRGWVTVEDDYEGPRVELTVEGRAAVERWRDILP